MLFLANLEIESRRKRFINTIYFRTNRLSLRKNNEPQMKVDDGCVCFLKLDDDLNALLKQGDTQATKLECSKAII